MLFLSMKTLAIIIKKLANGASHIALPTVSHAVIWVGIVISAAHRRKFGSTSARLF